MKERESHETEAKCQNCSVGIAETKSNGTRVEENKKH
jgi:hypothetical protein